MTRIFSSLVLSLVLVGDTNAFSPSSVKPLASVKPVASTTRIQSHAIEHDDEAVYMMMKAESCAHSESCSIDDAQQYLHEMIHMQSNCATGTLTSQQVCEDVQFPAEVIASLRAKISAEKE